MYGWLLLLDRRYEEALEVSLEFERKFPGPGATYLTAQIHLREPRLDLASEVAERAIRDFPKDIYFHPMHPSTTA
jgi:hypothetical protein